MTEERRRPTPLDRERTTIPTPRWSISTILAAAVVIGAPVAAQQPGSTVAPQYRSGLRPGDSVVATPTGRYDASALHRWVMGNGHRDLWAAPVRAEVLDLATFAGGLTPTRVGGGLQTRSLRFDGADGVEYGFRSIDKDASRTLDPELRRTLAADVVQDQIASLFPLSAMVVTRLLDAAGVLHPDPRLYVMPDDPGLGEFREDFAGLLGWIEVRPDEGADDTPGFAGSSRVVGSDTFLERLEERFDNRVDAPAYLRARLLDFLVGDWDRHPDQWRWAGFRDDEDELLLFDPIPRDRDWALARLDGMVARFSWVPWPHYVGFSHDYPSAFRISWSGRALDRRLLPQLSWPEWEAVVGDLESRLTDDVILGAVRTLPPNYYDAIGEEMEAALLNRRDDLGRLAREFYELQAGWVDVHVTDEGELARLERLPGGRLGVEVYDFRNGEPRPQPHFARVFEPEETREVRLDMHGGDDRIEVFGEESGPITIRVLGGGADDHFTDRTSGNGVHFYDHQGDNVFESASGTHVDETDWDDPVDPESNTHQAGSRDWGARWLPLPKIGYSPDLGFQIGGGARRLGYGFRHYPYASDFSVWASYATLGGWSGGIAADLPVRGDRIRGLIELEAIGAEFVRFYGYGNETISESSASYEAERQELRLDAHLVFAPSDHVRLRFGPSLLALRPEEDAGTVIDQLQPYGYEDFETVSLTGSLSWNDVDDPVEPRHGSTLDVEGAWTPELLSTQYAFGSLRAVGTTHLSADESLMQPSLALRVGAEKLWGTFPYHEAAYLGGSSSLRGFRNYRFAGDGSVFGNAELRLFVTHFVFLLPGDLGIFGLADTGRVFLDGEDSDEWHSSLGGGLWVDWVDTYSFNIALASSPEDTFVYFGLGFSF